MQELDRIIAQLEQRRAALDRALSALRALGSTGRSSSAAPPQPEGAGTKKGGITPAGRRKIVEALRKRWAQKRAAQAEEQRGQKNAAVAQKRRATLARKRMSEAMKQRWAAKRALKTSQERAAKRALSAKKNAAAKTNVVDGKAISNQDAVPAKA